MNAESRIVDPSANDWHAENLQVLAAEFASLVARIEGRAMEPLPGPLEAGSAIERATRAFRLSRFERAILLLCAGTEMQASLADAINSATSGRGVTFRFAMSLFEDAHWSALAPHSPLRRWRLVEVQEGQSLVTSALRIDERILHFLSGLNQVDRRIAPLLRRALSRAELAPSHEATMNELVAAWDQAAWPYPLVELAGDDPGAAEEIVAHAADSLGHAAFVLRAEDIPSAAEEVDALATLWQRESVLLPAILVVSASDVPPNSLASLVDRVQTPLAISLREPLRSRRTSLVREVDKPPVAEQRLLWQSSLPACALMDPTIDAVAAHFRFSTYSIADAAAKVDQAVQGGGDPRQVLWETCRRLGRHRIDKLAQRIDSSSHWDDLVLPEAQTSALRQVAVHLRHRLKVYDAWGFGSCGPRGLGLSALFCGESGTGKTLAAEVVANTLSLDLYRIDLASVVSKYIGETEKNLSRVFDAAEDSGAILLFDEADALFGKRSETKDSHDRYANIEVSYLLQRMESYRGLAILTTNMKGALDPAFQRRIRFIVNFPYPDATQREAIWRRAFPAATPTQGLDFARLASLHVTGGSIRNIAMQAAFLAADEGESVGMRHVLRGARTERSKAERPMSDAETRGWV